MGHPRQRMDPSRDGLQTLRTVVHGITGSHVRQQRLRRANVGGGLVPPNVLLPRLHRHPKAGLALRIHRDADDPPRHLPGVLVRRGEEPRVGAAEAHGDAETLRRSDGDVGPPRGGRGEFGQGQEVGRADDHGPADVRPPRELGVGLSRRLHRAVRVGVLHDGAAVLARVHLRRRVIPHDHVDADRLRPGLNQRDCLGMHVVADEELILLPLLSLEAEAHLHRLRGRRALVQQAGHAHGQSRQIGAERLKVEEHLQPALGDLGLVGGVGRVPPGVLEHVSQYHVRNDRVVVSHADVGFHHLILIGHRFDGGEGLRLRHCRLEFQRFGREDVGRDGRGDEGVKGVEADRLEHQSGVLIVRSHVTTREGIRHVQRIARKDARGMDRPSRRDRRASGLRRGIGGIVGEFGRRSRQVAVDRSPHGGR
mmetsp:Transcript_12825/g.27710  ORF Transcript_12825/g.27710 Transcript_12825/m.27710 type:complete len:423 (-) Transcript_12825:102-1370(-)